MILFWNRKEVFVGYSMEQFAAFRQKLVDNGIQYDFKLVSNNNNNALFGSGRSRTGTFGENMAYMTMYYLYVHKKDYEYACAVLRGGRF